MRIAYSIILNGLHHLTHNDYAKFILSEFDHWIVIEGATSNGGSTGWCRTMPTDYHQNGNSIDGTVEFLETLSYQSDKLTLVKANGLWKSKDEMVNAAIAKVHELTKECMLFQIDIDEQWTHENIQSSISEMISNNAKTGSCFVNHYVGQGLVAVGPDWGGNLFNRVTWWKGDRYITHEPPVWEGGNGPSIILSSKIDHYSYYFEQDVKFKDKWYGGHQGVYRNWLRLQNETTFPQPIQYLFPHWKHRSTIIRKVNSNI